MCSTRTASSERRFSSRSAVISSAAAVRDSRASSDLRPVSSRCRRRSARTDSRAANSGCGAKASSICSPASTARASSFSTDSRWLAAAALSVSRVSRSSGTSMARSRVRLSTAVACLDLASPSRASSRPISSRRAGSSSLAWARAPKRCCAVSISSGDATSSLAMLSPTDFALPSASLARWFASCITCSNSPMSSKAPRRS